MDTRNYHRFRDTDEGPVPEELMATFGHDGTTRVLLRINGDAETAGWRTYTKSHFDKLLQWGNWLEGPLPVMEVI